MILNFWQIILNWIKQLGSNFRHESLKLFIKHSWTYYKREANLVRPGLDKRWPCYSLLLGKEKGRKLIKSLETERICSVSSAEECFNENSWDLCNCYRSLCSPHRHWQKSDLDDNGIDRWCSMPYYVMNTPGDNYSWVSVSAIGVMNVIADECHGDHVAQSAMKILQFWVLRDLQCLIHKYM